MSARKALRACRACAAPWEIPHAADCAAVAEERRHMEAIRVAWSNAPVPPPAKPPSRPLAAWEERSAQEAQEAQRWERETVLYLHLAVPLWVARFRDAGMSLEEVLEEGRRCGHDIAERGDVLQFGGKPGAKAEAFNALARGLAAASFVPGGVCFLGGHWESRELELTR